MAKCKTALHNLLWGLNVMVSPIYKEFPFVVVYCMTMGFQTLRNLHGRILTPDHLVTFSDIFGRMAVYLLFAWVFAGLISTCSRKWVKVVIYILVFALYYIQQFVHDLFSMNISVQLLVLLAETTSRESSEFIQDYFFSSSAFKILLKTGMFLVLAVFMERYWPRMFGVTWFKRQFCNAINCCIVPLLIWGAYNAQVYVQLLDIDNTDDLSIWPSFYCHPNDPLTSIIAALYGLDLTKSEMQKSVQTTLNANGKSCIDPSVDSLDVIFIIGESYIKWHASLYGYERNTTPCMDSERGRGNLFAFTNAVTPYTLTSKVVRNLLSCNSVSLREKWYDCPYFPSIFKRAGYDVYYFDNQLDMYPNSPHAYAVNSFVFNQDICKVSYTKWNDKGYQYDGEMIDYMIDESTKFDKPFNMVLLHLMGQHMQPKERFPHTKDNLYFCGNKFKMDKWMTTEKFQEVNDYDNATRYNDKQLGRLFEMYRNRNAIIVYLSDHGEEIYDYRDSKGRIQDSFTSNLLKYQYEVPFVVWMSDKYKACHPNIVNAVRASTDRPVMSDNICHFLFHVACINTIYYNASRDFISPEFVKNKRIIADNVDYDAIR